MSYRVVFNLPAERDVAEAIAWYEQQQAGLGRRFIQELDAIEAKLSSMPTAFPLVYGLFRRAVLNTFPYNVIYCIVDRQVFVVAVVHGKRHPRVWWSRKDAV